MLLPLASYCYKLAGLLPFIFGLVFGSNVLFFKYFFVFCRRNHLFCKGGKAFWEYFGSFFVNCFSNNTSLNAYRKEILGII